MKLSINAVSWPEAAQKITSKLGLDAELGGLVSAICTPSDGTQVYINIPSEIQDTHSLTVLQYMWRGAVYNQARTIAALADLGVGTYNQIGDKYVARAQAVKKCLLAG